MPSSSPGGLSRAFTGNTFGKKIESIDTETQFIPYGAYKDAVSNASLLESERDDLKRRLEILTTTTKAMHSSVKRSLLAKIKTKDEYIERCLQLVRDFHPETSKSVLEAEVSSLLQKSKADSIAAEKVGVALVENDKIVDSSHHEDSHDNSTALTMCRAKLEWSEKRNKALKTELKRFGSFYDEVAQVLKLPLTIERWNSLNDALMRAESGTVLVNDEEDVNDDDDDEETEVSNEGQEGRGRLLAQGDTFIDGISKGAETRLSTSLNVDIATSQSDLAKKELQLVKDALLAERSKNATHSQSIENLTDKIDDLEMKLSSALSKIKVLTDSVSDSSSKSGASSQEKESLLSSLAESRMEAKAAREQVSSLIERLDDEKELVASLKNRLEGEQERALILNDEITKLRANVQTLEASSKGSLSTAEADLASLRKKVEELKNHIVEQEKSLASKQAEADGLDKLMKEALVGRASAEADVEKAKAMSKAQLAKLQKQANEQFEALKALAVKEKDDAVKAIEQQVQRSVTLKLTATAQEAVELKKMHASLKVSTKSAIESSRALAMNTIRDLYSRAAPAIEGYKEAMHRLRVEMVERRRLFNIVQELRGNIRVICRVRPPVSSDSGSGDIAVSFPNQGGLHEDGVHEEITVVNNNRTSKSWEFDSVFQPSASNKDVFAAVEALVTSVADGFNVCIFAYGQTGSGKTHTMEGTPTNPGINVRTLEALFALKAERTREVTCSISVSLLEIYNEQLRDMMAPVSKGAHPEPLIMRDSGGIGGVTIPGLTSFPVSSHEEVLHLMSTAYKNRTTFATNMNEHSSRSHCVLTIVVSSLNKVTNTSLKGKLHLIDLAGSERIGKSGATGDRLKEAQAINKSLSALGDVIQARGEKKAHIPFRNSVLTHLLSDSLSGDAKTLMIVNVSPSLSSSEETFCSLNFAARVRSVELGQAKKNVQQT